jgi:hypothetical protein
MELPMSDDWFVLALEAVDDAAREVHASVDSVVAMLRDAAGKHSEGSPLHAVVAALVESGGRSARLAPTLAYERFEAAVTAYRSQAIRALVDEEGMSFTEIGRLTGVSRQMVARLYRSAQEQAGTG